jgi:predicted MFS family arabinose efflux permease
MILPARTRYVDRRAESGSLLEALRHLGRHRGLVLLLVLAGTLCLFGWPVLSLLPDVSVKRLHAGHRGYSFLLSALGCGALVGSLLVASFGSRRRGRGVLLATGVGLAGLGLGGLALARGLALGTACCAVLGCGLILFFANGQATMQLGSGDHNRGRILAVWLMVQSGALPLGNLLAGQLADHCGVALVLAGQSAGIAVIGAIVLLLAVLARRTPVASTAVPAALTVRRSA